MRVLGVDPGSATTGFGAIDWTCNRLQYVAAGTIRTNPQRTRAERLKQLYSALTATIEKLEPQVLSLECSFVAINVQTAFRLGEARAMAMLAAAQAGIALAEYAPAQVKLTVAAHGGADKHSVRAMVCRILEIQSADLSTDATDALALAICHTRMAQYQMTATARP